MYFLFGCQPRRSMLVLLNLSFYIITGSSGTRLCIPLSQRPWRPLLPTEDPSSRISWREWGNDPEYHGGNGGMIQNIMEGMGE